VKALLRKLFSPLLSYFENGEEPYSYKKSYRTILIMVGALFMLLSGFLVSLGITYNQSGVLIPCVVFFLVAVTALVVGFLGSDRAVSKIWGNK